MRYFIVEGKFENSKGWALFNMCVRWDSFPSRHLLCESQIGEVAKKGIAITESDITFYMIKEVSKEDFESWKKSK